MNSIARNWRVVVGGVAAGSAVLLGFAGANASAEPVLPVPPAPAPVTVTQTVTVSPQAAAGTAATAPAATAAVAAPAATAAVAAPELVTVAQLPPATSGTLTEFFTDKGVVVEPQKAEGFTALNLVLPMPTGWTVVPDPNVPDVFTVIADRNGGDALYTPNAQLFVSKLVGDFDPREAISHGYIDSQKLFAWQSTAASMADFGGFPSSVIGGTYRENDITLNTSRRHVIATSGDDTYLVSLFVTTSANQVVATAAATDAIINGFKVTDPKAAPPPPATAAAAAPAAAPVTDAAAPAAALPAAPSAPVAAVAPAAPAVPAAAAAPAAPVAVAPVPATAPAPAVAPTAVSSAVLPAQPAR